MDFGFTIAAYAVAAVLFILSLGGLSGQESAKRAIWYGIVGMTMMARGSECVADHHHRTRARSCGDLAPRDVGGVHLHSPTVYDSSTQLLYARIRSSAL